MKTLLEAMHNLKENKEEFTKSDLNELNSIMVNAGLPEFKNKTKSNDGLVLLKTKDFKVDSV